MGPIWYTQVELAGMMTTGCWYYWALELVDPMTNGCRTSGPEYYWALGLVDPRTTGRRTKNPSTTGMYPDA